MYQALIEGKTLINKKGERLTFRDTIFNEPEDWDVEVIYEWQWIVKKSCSDPFTMTDYHTKEEFVDIGYHFIERYEISKRERL